MRLAALGSAATTILLVAACSSTSDPTVGDQLGELNTPARSWSSHPAIVEIDEAGDVYAVSDVHGQYEMFAELLEANHLASDTRPDPSKATWTGGSAVLVIAGDLIDKGPKSLEVIDLVRALQSSAPGSGGRVVTTMGNHEAEFLVDPENHKATSTGQDAEGIDNELDAAKISPGSLVKGTDEAGRGKWLSELPLGVRVKKWFFSHAGNSQKLSIKDLARKLENSIDHNGYGDKDITGNDSILEAQNWYSKPDKDDCGKEEADALGVVHIVFGHDPGALDDRGRIAMSKNQILIKIDTAMGIHDGSSVEPAVLLHIDTKGTDTAESLDVHGGSKKLF